MKYPAIKITIWGVIAAFLVMNAAALDLDMARFATAKKNQVRTLAENLTNRVPSFVWSYFDAVRVDDWETATNLGSRIMKSRRYSQTDADAFPPALQTLIWPPITETIGAYEQFHSWDNQWLHRFGSNIITSLPSGSIYFGGTDPGRFIVTAMKESEFSERPFFVLTQNQLVDVQYLYYLHQLYGAKFYIPTTNDLQAAFSNYLAGAEKRLASGKLKPGENVGTNESGKITASGQVAVMEINGLLAKTILEKNPDRNFYIEESFPLDWMFPYLSPHGLILELHHKPLDGMPEETLQTDREYWKKFTGELIGDWINDETSIKEISDFDIKVYVQTNYTGFKGSVAFVKNKESRACFSKLRSSIAGLYAWRMNHAQTAAEKDRMRSAAHRAYCQAFALCPDSPEVVYRYTELLMSLKRGEDAVTVVETAIRVWPEESQFKDLLKVVKKTI